MTAAVSGNVSFDPDQLREKYREERDKRIRADGNDQYIEVSGDFSHYIDDQREVERAIASLRNHQGFHEQCVEDLYSRLENALLPAELHVVGFFQRRGGVDITPWRSSAALPPCLTRLYEQ